MEKTETQGLEEGDFVLCPYQSWWEEGKTILFRISRPGSFMENSWISDSREECVLMAESAGVPVGKILEFPFEVDVAAAYRGKIAIPFGNRNLLEGGS